MRYDEGLHMWVRFEEESMRTPPKVLAYALYSDSEEAIKRNTSEVQSLVLEMFN